MSVQQQQEALPVAAYKGEIMACQSPYIIIQADTGSGKSTKIMCWLLERGYRVLSAQPLVETVIGLAEYVASLEGCEVGTKVGYRTGEEKLSSRDTRLMYCTTELALIRDLFGHNGQFDVLVIDEFHEGKIDQHTLEAWAWKQIEDGTAPFKHVLVMSATIDAEKISQARGNAPVFTIPGRQFEIEDRAPLSTMAADITSYVHEGCDVLVFVPGKKEIDECLEAIGHLDAELIPFHGQLSRAEKNRAYEFSQRPRVIVSTNALETGRTLLPSPGRKLAVVDSGEERLIELDGSVETLVTRPIAKSRGKQRRGRTGRVGIGYYTDRCEVAYDARPDFPIPDIQRMNLDKTVLRLAMVGLDAEELPFIALPPEGSIHQAKVNLKAHGCLSADGKITEFGKKVVRLPLTPEYGVMVLKAAELGVTDDVVTIAAIMGADGITKRKSIAWYRIVNEEMGEMESECDLLAQLVVFNYVRRLHLKREDMEAQGVNPNAFFKALRQRQTIVDALRNSKIRFGSTGNRQDIIKAICAGMMNNVFCNRYGGYVGSNGQTRQLSKESIVRGAQIIVGKPIGVPGKNRWGSEITIPLVSLATQVTADLLVEVAPHLIRVEQGDCPRFNVERDCIESIQRVYFADQLVSEGYADDPEHPEAAQLLATFVATQLCQAAGVA
jgi:HrpA-like RNA helicase